MHLTGISYLKKYIYIWGPLVFMFDYVPCKSAQLLISSIKFSCFYGAFYKDFRVVCVHY